ncbi:MAG: hypothetical protein Q8N35_17195 [Methylococcaceae bacterium]|nr:hypothetical protein [Methylococcaceae bacterium]MDZ4157944.1 hypothetical protein [Methylococcales bacterium]MDP2393450.1 hypothetical protein [Methylococcaceae bacterium]MDP3021320.1 hypothetical protein [Methylococcaceae bacterium]MDP3391089.1 hypothetical protein [Methylococcaceae bacterium]
MSNAVINKLFKGLKLPKADRAEFDRILNRPEVQAVVNADEIERITARKTLIQELKGLPAQFTKAKALAERAAVAAVKRFDLAEAEFYAAKAGRNMAWMEASGLDQQMQGRERAIERELAAGADHRIAEYRFEINNLLGRVRVKEEYWFDHDGTWVNGVQGTIQRSNIDDVISATDNLNNAVTALNDLQLSAATYTEVTQNLRGLSDTLRAPLAKLKMHPPTLDKLDNVKAPQKDGDAVLRFQD